MVGANYYANLFKTGQYGRLYIVSGEHARGKTFRIFVLPAGVEAIKGGSQNGPYNTGAVEVYGVVSGHPGWTEVYGWLHHGPWQHDFAEMVRQREEERMQEQTRADLEAKRARAEHDRRIQELLSQY